MSDPRFRPRTYARVPSQFGRAEDIPWLSATSNAQQSRLDTARLQSLFAARIRARLHDRRLTIKQYADMVDIGYDRMAKVLRGETLMRLEDIADAERVLGGVIRRSQPH